MIASRRDAAVIAVLTDVVARYGRWGFWKCVGRIRVEGHAWNHKRVHRVYCALRLNLPRRTVRRVPKRLRQPLAAPPVLNQTWALDFVSDTFYDGRRIRALTILDEGNREGLEITVGVSVPSRRVRPGISRAALCRVGGRASGRHSLHPTRQARSERLHRTIQSQLSHGGAQRPRLRLDDGAAGSD